MISICETGEADYPFEFSVKSIRNLFSIKDHINSREYNSNEIDFPYFTLLESKEDLKKKKNFFEKIIEKTSKFIKLNKKDQKNEQEQEEKNDENHHKKHLKEIIKNYPLNIKTQSELNYLKIKQNKEKNLYTFSKFINLASYTAPSEKINKLSHMDNTFSNYTDLKQISNEDGNEHSINYPFFQESLLLKDYQYPFNINPIYLKLEIFLYYGSYDIVQLDSRHFIINNDISIEEKFISQNFLISNIPREARICINIHAYDKQKIKSFVLGSCSTALYDENGKMKQGIQELSIWPLFQIDPRTICTNNH